MIVQSASYGWAYADDIPGSRCGPEDGPWPRAYEILEEPAIRRELSILAKPQSVQFDASLGWKADSINFQPCPKSRTQDRYVVQQLNIHGRLWTLTGVFDGHLGDATVEHAAHRLPIVIRDSLLSTFAKDAPQSTSPSIITNLLSRSIVAFDDAIAHDVLDLFGGIAGISNFSDRDIWRRINDRHHGGANHHKVKICMHGTTALVALVDPDHTNLWIANLGDSHAFLVSQSDGSDKWQVESLTVDQNGDNNDEIARVQREHPGEPECVVNRRVLGALAPFRSLGDVAFKQPPEFTRRILYNLSPGFASTALWEAFLVRNRTPPYLSATPEVTHRRLDGSPCSNSRFLILSSDGFADLCDGEKQERIIRDWASSMVKQKMANEDKPHNMALSLLRQALGGEDHFSVSRVLTLDMAEAWIDDTAIVVQTL